MALSDNDLFVVQDPTDSKFYKLTLAELSAKTADSANNGAININGGDGITASGDNASANQTASTTRLLSIDTTWLNDWIDSDKPINDAAINFDAGNGLTSTGDNATANQSVGTTKTFLVAAADDTITVAADGISVNKANLNNGAINFNAGNGLTSTGNNATANQSGDSTKTFSVLADGTSISVGADGISVAEVDGGAY